MALGYLDVFSKRDLWRNVCDKFNGKLEIKSTPGNVLEMHKLTIPFEKWELVLTESDTKPLKFEINFESSVDYRLILGHEDFFVKILKRLGKKEVEIGNKEFDSLYFIETNKNFETTKLLSKEIAECILKQKVYSIAYSTDTKKQTSDLISVISMTVDNLTDIEELIDLHFEIIKNLKGQRIIK